MVETPNEISWLQIDAVFPTTEQKKMLEKYKLYKYLYRGWHKDVFKMPSFQRLNPNVKEDVEIIVNFPAAVSRVYSDLLFGDMPTFDSPDQTVNSWLQDFIIDNDFDNELVIGGDAQSMRGQAIIVIWKGGGKSKMKFISSEHWFPVEATDDLSKRFDGHVIGYFEDVERKMQYKTELLTVFHATIYFPNAIYYWDYEIKDSKIVKITERKPTDELPFQELLVIPVYNIVTDDDIYGISDYESSISIFHALDKRLTATDKILDKHASPTLMGGDSHISAIIDPTSHKPVAKVFEKDDYMVVDSDEMTPEYLTWDGKLNDSFNMVQELKQQAYLNTDTNAILFGQFGAGEIPSGSALKKLLYRPMARKNRKKNQFIKALKTALSICFMLEYDTVERPEIALNFKSGLPIDEYETAQIAQMRSGGVRTMSNERIWKQLDGMADSGVQKEQEALQDDLSIEKSSNKTDYQPGAQTGNGQSSSDVTNGGNNVSNDGRNY